MKYLISTLILFFSVKVYAIDSTKLATANGDSPWNRDKELIGYWELDEEKIVGWANSYLNIEYLHLAGKNIKDQVHFDSFKNLRSIFLVSYKGNRLDSFNDSNLEDFRAIRGNIEIIDFSSKYFLLQSCQKLARFDKITSDYITLDNCNNLDLDSLGNVSGLEVLEIRGRKSIEDMDFLKLCKKLQYLEVTATSLKNTDLSGFSKSPVLRRCFWGQCSKKDLLEIASKYNEVLFSNGDVTVKGEEEFDYSYFQGY